MKPHVKVSLSAIIDNKPVQAHLCTIKGTEVARVVCGERVIASVEADGDSFAEAAESALESAAYRIRCDVAVGSAIRSAVERRPALKPFLMSLLNMIAEDLTPEEKATLDWYKTFK